MNETTTHSLEADRRTKLDRLRNELGINPFGQRTDGLSTLADAKAIFDERAHDAHKASIAAVKEDSAAEIVDDRPRVRIAGRVVLHRDNGRLQWLKLRDHSGDLQVAVSKRDTDATAFAQAKLCDLGDILVASGPVMKTNTDEVTVWAEDVTIACKSLTPPPEKWSGLSDPELRYRRRHVDLAASPETLRVFQMRSAIVSGLRHLLTEQDYLEVETPMMHTMAGGAAARPFTTHMNALNLDLFLRIAPELYLKRLLVGGMPRIFEIGRNFRNEGLDRRHNPEFTTVEVYEAFGNCETMLELTESLIRASARLVAQQAGSATLPFGDLTIDYAEPFDQTTYSTLFEQALGYPITDMDRARANAKARGLKHEGLADALVISELFEEVAEKSLDPARPTFVRDYPAALSPLTRPNPADPAIAERWELLIGGMELGTGYTELNDPDVQAAAFRQQFDGIDDEESTFRNFDADFIDALKVGMPPAGGMGLGVDRLVMLLTNCRSIRDVILFPMLRPDPRADG
ncbi:MAG: lysine--tRNA ligase [Phycisphaerales bacterium]|nr:lysine--tRNA ligase [Phycisphaerales bacterium]